jgi:hypothetical protein
MKYSWEELIPWYMTIVSTIVLISLALFLTSNIDWFKNQALLSNGWNSELFQIHIHHLHLSMIKRSVGLFSGFSVLFIGMAVSFYSLKNQSKMDLKTVNISMAVATSSPGIIAMVLGSYLIISTVESKDHFEPYPRTVVENNNSEINKPQSLFEEE